MRVREEEFDKEQVIRVLYQDCLAVNVLPAPFYLEKVVKLFQTDDLPRGELTSHGREMDLKAIRKTVLMTVHGQCDDICIAG